MNIYFDENMPYAAELFARFGQVKPFVGRLCDSEMLRDADVLLVRSVTSVDEKRLAHATQLKFVGTATIGVDHIDQHYLQQRGIGFSAAPGCNAISVAEYVLSAIKVLEQRYGFSLQQQTVGIVGAGNTGSALAQKLAVLGVRTLLCDPPLAANIQPAGKHSDPREFIDYEQLLQQADIISFHVPLLREGDHPTYHLFGAAQLQMIKPDAVIINACRGEVFDNQALLAHQQWTHHPLVLDVWEGEPQVLMPLLAHVDIATAHIAGYSLEGKARGTFMLYQAFIEHCRATMPAAQFAQLNTASEQLNDWLPDSPISQVVLAKAGDPAALTGPIDQGLVNQLIHLVYDVRRDDALFRQHIADQGFDWLRKNYPIRREFSSLSIVAEAKADSQQQNTTLALLNQLGFKRGEK